MNIGQTGEFLVKLRKKKDMTQKELAKILGVSEKTISEWERGITSPDISLLDDIARIFDTTILEILRGKELEKEEVIENKTLIETMKYAALDTKNRLKRKLSTLCILMVCLCAVLVVFFNIKGLYYVNKTYETNDNYVVENLFTEVNANIEMIINNQGKFTDEEYEEILSYVKAIKDLNNIPETEKIFMQKKYTYQDIKEYAESINMYSLYGYNMRVNNTIYDIILKYNLNKTSAMSLYIGLRNECINILEDLYEFINIPYYNDETLDIDPALKLKNLILNQYYSYNIILKDIIEVGVVND